MSKPLTARQVPQHPAMAAWAEVQQAKARDGNRPCWRENEIKAIMLRSAASQPRRRACARGGEGRGGRPHNRGWAGRVKRSGQPKQRLPPTGVKHLRSSDPQQQQAPGRCALLPTARQTATHRQQAHKCQERKGGAALPLPTASACITGLARTVRARQGAAQRGRAEWTGRVGVQRGGGEERQRGKKAREKQGQAEPWLHLELRGPHAGPAGANVRACRPQFQAEWAAAEQRDVNLRE